MQQWYRPSLKIKRLKETITLTIATQLAQKHAEKIFPGNGISIINFNILEKMSPTYHFPIPYLATFSIAGSQKSGIKIAFPMFCNLQIVPRVLRYTNWLLNSHIILSFVLHLLHSKVLRHTIWPSGPQVSWGTLFTLFWSLSAHFPYLAISWNLFRRSSSWQVHKISNS